MTAPLPSRRPAAAAPADAGAAQTLARLRGLATLLDRAFAIPGTKIRVGLDPIIGLIPGGGDLATGLFSIYLVMHAARLGVPRATLLRMLGNVLVDTAAGSVPLVGDLFDVAWRSNTRNVDLLARHVEAPAAAGRESRLVAWGAVALMVLLVLAGLVLTVVVVRWIAAQL